MQFENANVTQRRPLVGTTASTGVVALLALCSVLIGPSPAWAKDYPTWSDVVAARADEASTTRAIAEIEALLGILQAEVITAQAEADAKGDLWIEADIAFQEAAKKTEELQAQATIASTTADDSRQIVGQMIAQMARGTGVDSSMLFGKTGDIDGLLSRLAMSSKLAEQSNQLFEKAVQDRNTAQSLTDQARAAASLREKLESVAEAAFLEAEALSALADAKLAEQTDNQARLNQQLLVLKERRAVVETDYQAGEAERQAAAAAGAASAGTDQISATGWARPVNGRVTSPFGYRIHPIAKVRRLHTGTDIGASCGQPLYSAAAGTVAYAGRNGGYGNFVLIDNGSGINTAYAHIVDGGILVSKGQQVSAGQNIARVGTTGASTGCHAHFEVRQNGVAIDPPTFLRDRGASLG